MAVFAHFGSLNLRSRYSWVPYNDVHFRSELPDRLAYYPIFVYDLYDRANMARSVDSDHVSKIIDAFRQTRDALLTDPLTPPTLEKLRIVLAN